MNNLRPNHDRTYPKTAEQKLAIEYLKSKVNHTQSQYNIHQKDSSIFQPAPQNSKVQNSKTIHVEDNKIIDQKQKLNINLHPVPEGLSPKHPILRQIMRPKISSFVNQIEIKELTSSDQYLNNYPPSPARSMMSHTVSFTNVDTPRKTGASKYWSRALGSSKFMGKSQLMMIPKNIDRTLSRYFKA